MIFLLVPTTYTITITIGQSLFFMAFQGLLLVELVELNKVAGAFAVDAGVGATDFINVVLTLTVFLFLFLVLLILLG